MRTLLLTFSLLLITFAASAGTADSYAKPEKAQFFKADLKRLVQANDIKSTSDLLSKLPAEMFKIPAIIFKSRSLQEASFANPRVVLFNGDASLAISFNGDPSQEGYEAIEIMNFDNDKLAFEFEEIVFEKDLADRENYLLLQNLKQEIEGLKDRSTRSGINPKVCLACHRENPRPNWESYPIWPGVFGQSDDNLYVFNDQESKAATEFVRRKSENSRYKFLLFPKGYMEPSNARITFLLSQLNFKRLAKRILCHPDYNNYSYFFDAYAGKLFTVDEYKLPLAELKKKILSQPGLNFESSLEDLKERIKKDQMYNIAIMDEIVKDGRYVTFITPNTSYTVLLKYVLETKMNINLSEFEMTFLKGTYNFGTPEFGSRDLIPVIKQMKGKVRCD
jgi:hypothetical protein